MMQRLTNKTMIETYFDDGSILGDGVVFLRDNIDQYIYGSSSYGAQLYHEFDTPLIEQHLMEVYGDCKLLVYPRANVTDFAHFRDAFNRFCRANVYGIAKKYEVTRALFNPLWNVDGTETTTYNIQDKTTYESDQNTIYNSEMMSNGTNTNTHTDTEVREVQNLNDVTTSTDYQVDSRATMFETSKNVTERGSEDSPVTSVSKVNSGTIIDETILDSTDTHSGNDKLEHRGDDTALKTGTEIHERHGNIGVTKSSELLADSINVLGNFSFWEDLMESFVRTTCILSYEDEEE